MSHLWRRKDDGWTIVGLGELAVGRAGAAGSLPVIVRADDGAGGAWLLVASVAAGVAVNGSRVVTGIVALADRDEIRLADGTRFFFSSECAARVESFTAPPPDLRCPRCRRPFEAGTPIVRCPTRGCGVVHHQSDALPCFDCAAECAVCGQRTPLDADGPCWTPEEL